MVNFFFFFFFFFFDDILSRVIFYVILVPVLCSYIVTKFITKNGEFKSVYFKMIFEKFHGYGIGGMSTQSIPENSSLFTKKNKTKEIVVFLLRKTKQRKHSLFFFFQVTTTTDHLDIVQTKLLSFRFFQDICLLMSTDNCHMQKSHKQTDKKKQKKQNTF